MCDPIVIGVITAGLGIAQSVAGYQQAKTNVAYANAQAQQDFEFQKAQVQSQRNYEDMREQQQQFLLEQNSMLADQAYADEIAALNLRFMEEQEASAQRRQEALKTSARGAGEIRAAGRIGLAPQQLLADVYRQQAAYDYATERNLAFVGMQTQAEKRGSAATYVSRLNSQQPYIKQQFVDPRAPIKQPSPSKLPFVLGGASSILDGVMTGLSVASGMPDKPNPPPGGSPGGSPGGGTFRYNGPDLSGGTFKYSGPNYSGAFKQPGRSS